MATGLATTGWRRPCTQSQPCCASSRAALCKKPASSAHSTALHGAGLNKQPPCTHLCPLTLMDTTCLSRKSKTVSGLQSGATSPALAASRCSGSSEPCSCGGRAGGPQGRWAATEGRAPPAAPFPQPARFAESSDPPIPASPECQDAPLPAWPPAPLLPSPVLAPRWARRHHTGRPARPPSRRAHLPQPLQHRVHALHRLKLAVVGAAHHDHHTCVCVWGGPRGEVSAPRRAPGQWVGSAGGVQSGRRCALGDAGGRASRRGASLGAAPQDGWPSTCRWRAKCTDRVPSPIVFSSIFSRIFSGSSTAGGHTNTGSVSSVGAAHACPHACMFEVKGRHPDRGTALLALSPAGPRTPPARCFPPRRCKTSPYSPAHVPSLPPRLGADPQTQAVLLLPTQSVLPLTQAVLPHILIARLHIKVGAELQEYGHGGWVGFRGACQPGWGAGV